MTCRIDDRIGDVAARVRAAGQRSCLVTTTEGVLLGRLDKQALTAHADTAADAVMTPGPLTIRPDRPLEEVRERLGKRGVGEVIVTTADGVLVGVLEIAASLPTDEALSCDCAT